MNRQEFILSNWHTGLKCKLNQKGKFNLDEEYPEPHNEICEIVNIINAGDRYEFDISNGDISYDGIEIDEFDIILRPLSELTEPCLENKLVPIELLFESDYPEHAPKGRKCFYTNSGRFISCSGGWCSASTSFNIRNIELNNFWKIQKMIDWKFDILHLIDKNEAIDYTTLEGFVF